MAYVCGDERCLFALRLTVENLFSWWIGGQSEGGECVHDEVDPEKLNGFENRSHFCVVDGGDEGEQDSGNVDGDLELWSVSILGEPRGGELYSNENGLLEGTFGQHRSRLVPISMLSRWRQSYRP